MVVRSPGGACPALAAPAAQQGSLRDSILAAHVEELAFNGRESRLSP